MERDGEYGATAVLSYDGTRYRTSVLSGGTHRVLFTSFLTENICEEIEIHQYSTSKQVQVDFS